jgi:hypothetical protein
MSKRFRGAIDVDDRDSVPDWEPYVDLELEALGMMKRE